MCKKFKSKNNLFYSIQTSALMDSRTIKTPQEIFLLRIVSEITSSAHKRLMEECTPGLYEYQAESLFLFETYNCFLRQQSYVPIVASGYNSAILHYTTNDRKMLDGDLLLVSLFILFFFKPYNYLRLMLQENMLDMAQMLQEHFLLMEYLQMNKGSFIKQF